MADKDPEGDPFLEIADDLKEMSKHAPDEVRQRLYRHAQFLREFVGAAEEDPDDDDPDEDGDHTHCHRCAHDSTILSILPVTGDWRAVFAEGDKQDPSKMSVDPVVAFAEIVMPGGHKNVSGLVVFEDDFIICGDVGTFMGYVPPGKSPDMYAEKVKKYFTEIRKEEEGDPKK